MEDLKQGLAGFKKSAKKKYAQVTGQPPPQDEESGLLADLKDSADEMCGGVCKLSRKQRLYGFAYCLAGGIACSCVGVLCWGLRNIVGFAVFYSLGTIMSLGSSLFLWGPWYQIKNMLKETRLAATLIMLAAIGCTLYIALYLDPKNRKKEKEDQKNYTGLIMLSVVVQSLAFTWYGLSYIPFARTMVKKCFRSATGM